MIVKLIDLILDTLFTPEEIKKLEQNLKNQKKFEV